MNLDDRLRAAGDALREGSDTQVDAASALRVIHLRADHLAGEPADPAAPPPAPPAGRLAGRPQRLVALVANLLLVLVLGVAIGIGVRPGQAPSAPAPPLRTGATVTSTTATLAQTRTSVPEACLETAELADDVISRLNRNIRDERLFLALRDYTIASQACRRASSP